MKASKSHNIPNQQMTAYWKECANGRIKIYILMTRTKFYFVSDSKKHFYWELEVIQASKSLPFATFQTKRMTAGRDVVMVVSKFTY